MMTTSELLGRRWALIVGHPGHELRVWKWMRTVAPIVGVLTDGSGHGADSRLELSRAECGRAAARISSWFGVATDSEIYQAILEHDVQFFVGLSDALATLLIDEAIDCVAGDATEGYNPTHDVCRLLIDRAVRVAFGARALTNFEFPLMNARGPLDAHAQAVHVDLSPPELALKVDACRSYAAAAGGTLLAEVATMLGEQDESTLSREYLTPVAAGSAVNYAAGYQPFYERYGEQQVAAGRYRVVIRYGEHILPIARALEG
jgi:hypothetical protein